MIPWILPAALAFETSIYLMKIVVLFVAKHQTRPSLSQADKAEADLEVDQLVEDCLNKIETVLLKRRFIIFFMRDFTK